MGRMVSLRHLEIVGTDNLNCLPEGLGRISCLRTLSKFIVGGEGGCEIVELQRLNSLQGCLRIQNLERVFSGEEARKAELGNKPHLRQLIFEMGKGDEEIVRSEGDAEIEKMDSVLEGLRPHGNLEKLTLDCNKRSSKMPSWMEDSSFSKLTELEIRGFVGCEQNNLPELSKLPALKYLGISCVGVKNGNSGNDVVGRRSEAAFQKLERLVLEDVELEEWELTLEAFLQLWNRSNLEGLPQQLAIFPLLTELRIVRCHGIKGMGCSSSFPLLEKFTLISSFPLLEKFTLIDSSEIFSSELPHLPNLKEFYIQSIRNETLPDGGWDTGSIAAS